MTEDWVIRILRWARTLGVAAMALSILLLAAWLCWTAITEGAWFLTPMIVSVSVISEAALLTVIFDVWEE